MCLAQVRIQPRRLWDVVSPAHSVSPSESNSCRRVWNQGRRLPHHRLPWTVHRSGSPADQHIFLPFFGGPDDRLALSLVVQLCAGDSGVTATVVRVRKTGGTETVYATEEAKTTVHNVRVSHLEWNGMLITIVFYRLYSLTPFTVTSLLRPASHPTLPTTLFGAGIPPPKSQTQPSARLSAGSRLVKSAPISPFTSFKLSPPPFSSNQGERVRGAC